MKPEPHHPATSWQHRLLSVCACLPPAFILLSILRYGVNLPFWDQWGLLAPLFGLQAEGRLTWESLLAQANESRILFPRLISLGLGRVTGWNQYAELVAIFALACGIFLSLAYLIRHVTGRRSLRTAWLVLLASLLVFSPVHYENWLWGIQICTYLTLCALAVAFAVAYSPLPLLVRVLLCSGLATVMTFSFSNGLLGWIVLPVVLLAPGKDVRPGKLLAGGLLWAAAAALALGYFFHDYQVPQADLARSYARSHPAHILLFMVSFLGAPLSLQSLALSAVAGSVLLAVWAAGGLLALHPRLPPEFRRTLLLCAGMGGYAVASSLMAALGRAYYVAFGITPSLASRYCVHAVFLMVSVLLIVSQLRPALRVAKLQASRARLHAVGLASATALFLLLILHAASYGLEQMKTSWQERAYGRVAVHFASVAPEPWALHRYVFPSSENLIRLARETSSLGLLSPPLAESKSLTPFRRTSEPAAGIEDASIRHRRQQLVLDGWVVRTSRRGRTHAVLITSRLPDGEEIMVSFALPERLQPASHWPGAPAGAVRWRKVLPLHALPEGARTFSAWAFNLDEKSLAGDATLFTVEGL